jgi:hypothetical protein
MTKSIALLLAAWLLAGAAAAQMTMHRQQAEGAPDEKGWMLARSSLGRFSVRMPMKFNDFTVTEKDPGAPSLRTHTVGIRSSERIALVATRIEYREGTAAAKGFFERFETGRGFGVTPESVRQRKIGAQRAVDAVIRRGADVSYQRVVLLDADLLMLSVEAPKEHEALALELSAKFFESLRFDPK